MVRMCKTVGMLLLLVSATVGCRTPQPELKPPPQPEVLTVPPSEARFNSSQYPDLAYRDMNDRFRKPLDSNPNSILPARGLGSSMSPGGMGMRP